MNTQILAQRLAAWRQEPDYCHFTEAELIRIFYDALDDLPCSVHFTIGEAAGIVASARLSLITPDNLTLLPYGNFQTVLSGFLPSFGLLGRLAVLPEYRGNGFATELTQRRISYARRHFPHLILLTLLRPCAISQYADLGFQDFLSYSKNDYPGLPWTETVLAIFSPSK
ncbi:MAG TPA: GNAT family N-acetyltransferase [Saprospiraceae bacterium]|nr:GNAT family N-acetyltransferase [Saprospiraceae bacterium]